MTKKIEHLLGLLFYSELRPYESIEIYLKM